VVVVSLNFAAVLSTEWFYRCSQISFRIVAKNGSLVGSVGMLSSSPFTLTFTGDPDFPDGLHMSRIHYLILTSSMPKVLDVIVMPLIKASKATSRRETHLAKFYRFN
jgi:hypothetical protein